MRCPMSSSERMRKRGHRRHEELWRQDLPPIGNGLSQRRMRADSLEWDGYQVALIAPESHVDHADSSAPALARPAHVLVLPLTWKDLAVLMRADANSNSTDANRIFRFGQVGVDFGGMNVTRAGKLVALTSMEFKMLKFLVQRPGQVISRDELLNEVWGYDNYPNTRTVDNHILRLRQKLEQTRRTRSIFSPYIAPATNLFPEQETA